ncbi:11451_t:CDS:1, partial [Acaulospora colombiana]
MSSSSKLPLSAPPKRSRSSREQASYAPRSSNDISSADADDEFVLISKDGQLDSARSRPSLGGESAHYSDMGDSNMSHDPLLSSFNDTFENERLVASDNRPLTMNKLDPVQRAALVRQSRKLHKILGETPQIAEIPSPSTRPTGNKLQRRGTLAGSDIRLDRKAAMAALESPSLEPPPGSNWGKIASSLVATSPTLATPSNVPLLRLNVVQATGSSAPRQRRLSDSSVASSALSLMTNRQTDSTHTNQESAQTVYTTKAAKSPTVLYDASIYDLSSPVTPPSRQRSDHLQRQQSRARMAKVQQLMGESVPTELVLGPAAAKDLRKRRLSMESPTAPSFSNVQALKHKRSKSLWRKDFKETGFDSAPEPMPTSKTHSSC